MIKTVKHLIKALGYSWTGLKQTYKNELAFRLELLILAIIVPLVFFLNLTAFERLLLIGVWLFVMCLELINSAIEAVVDRISKEHHTLSGRAKDMAAASVFIGITLSVLTWMVVLFG